MRKYLRIVDDNRATKIVRFANYFIDYLVLYLFFFVLGVVGTLLTYVDVYFIYDWVMDESPGRKLLDSLVSISIYFLYLFGVETLTKGRSLGKLITGTKVVAIDGAVPTTKDFFIRNVSRLVPFDALSFFGNTGWHDNWSETRVVKIKDFENAKKSASEIQDIGQKITE